MGTRLVPLILTATLLIPGCSVGDEETTAGTTDSETTESTTEQAAPTEETAELTELSEGVEGQIGFRHGLDCVTVDDCSVYFTVESMNAIETCDGHAMGQPPADTDLVKASVLVEAVPTESDYDPSEFPIWSEWSALTGEGINQDLPSSSWCYNTDSGQQWQGAIRAGDTERRVHYMDVPAGTTNIRLTDTLTGARWEFPAP